MPTLEVAELRRRVVSFDQIEIREADSGLTINGHAAVFDELSEDLGGFREKIARGAFRKVLSQGPDVRLLINHDPNFVLARSTSGTLTLSEDPKGLAITAEAAPTAYAADLRTLIQRGDVDQMSFAFMVAKDEWDETDERNVLRTITEFEELYDVSVVTFPAYPQTEAQMRQVEFKTQAERREEVAAERRAARRRRLALRTKARSALAGAGIARSRNTERRRWGVVAGSVWGIRPESLTAILRHLTGPRAQDELDELVADEPAQSGAGPVAVLPLQGIIRPKASLLSMLFGGGGGLQDFRASLDAALTDDSVRAIVLDVDSPGGLADLVPEAAGDVRRASQQKPTVAVANTMAGSAAYWIASQASELVVTPSGDVGSIGVYAVHDDWSAFNEKMGVKPTYISAGKYKTEANPDEPLTDEAKTAIKERIDEVYAMFTRDVAKGRGVGVEDVRNGFGEARMVAAKKAVALGMADRVATLEETISELAAG